MKTMKIHPIAKKFPLLPAKEMKDLREDIKTNGIELPILVNKAKDTILDGRNRFMIAHELGLKDSEIPMEVFKGTDADIPNVILSRNVFRRHLSDDQRIALVTDIRAPQLEKEAAEREKSGSFVGDGKVKGSVADKLAEEGKTTKYKAEQALRARKKRTLGDVVKGKTSLKSAAGKRVARKAKAAPTLEDEVWTRFERFMKYWPQPKHREVKALLRKFLTK